MLAPYMQNSNSIDNTNDKLKSGIISILYYLKASFDPVGVELSFGRRTTSL